ncbi:uncharacterized protein EI97DRAFT_427256 [Westerdykella ornata]|uniref:Zn(2)-C6 fungal-type domain-containing protein n=1 Tax=Westerdykella ornata TaxID=318751 RepID=A0A6A6J6F2_WESOR|nr:uncharacterized protein EI97DRAFT_427256 [Westerdykella ornata]KAF2271972.1 hypothetical protein EI97DRAFT_427256 [Westerdykella ornata]
MQRRSHKKSRGGCLECKRRHVKCDGGRPICLLCKIAERECSYSSSILGRQTLPTPGASPQSRSTSPSVGIMERNPPVITEATNTDCGLTASIYSPVNLTHTALIVHLLTTKELFTLGDSVPDHAGGITYGLEIGLSHPYLLHALLAFSARHLAHVHHEPSIFPSTDGAASEASGIYTQQAIALQTRAIALFKEACHGSVPVPLNQSNCVPILLFSSVLGHHHLADTLAKRPAGGLEPFLSHYTHCIEMHRGIYTIARTAWPMLLQNERLEPVLTASAGLTSREPRGSECETLKMLFSSEQDVCGHNQEYTDEAERQACLTAIRYLQVGFDAILAANTADGQAATEQSRYHMVFSWTMLVPAQFTRLLAAKRPETLVVLGYYAILLHYARGLWQVKDAGTYIFGIIEEYLGPAWSQWLAYPRAMIRGI